MQKKLHTTQSGFLWNSIDDFFSKTHEYFFHNKPKEKLLFFFLLIFSFSGYSQLSTENFEGGIPGSWTRFQNSFATASWTTIADGYLGGNAAYINPASENIGAGNTAEYYLATPLVTVPVNGEVRFLTKQGSATNNGTIYQLRMSTSSQPDIDGFNVILQSWTEAQLNATATTYEEKVVPIPTGIPAGLDVYFAFVAVNAQTGAVASGDSWYVDNVRVIEGCLKVQQANFTVSNLTSNSATLSWTHLSVSNFEIQVVPQGNMPAANGTPTGNSYNTSSLAINTNYDVYIKTICDANTASGWAGPFPFKTLILGTRCDDPIVIAPTQAVPYVLNANLNIFQNANVTYPTAGTGCLASGVTGNYLSGAKAFFKFTPTQTGLMTITTNPLGTAGGAGCFANTSTGTFVYQDCASVGVSCLAGMTTNATGPKVLSNVYVQAGQTYYIVLSSNLTPSASICFNLKVEFATCGAPSVYSYKNLLQTSASFSWNNVGNLAGSWQYLVLPAAAAAPTAATSGTPTSTNIDNPATGLTANTAYKLYVRSVCGGTPGPWNSGYLFKTQCAPYSTPYSTQFTGTTATVSEACWTPIDVNGDGLTWSYSGYTFLQTSTYQNANDDMIATPQVNFTGAQKRLRYKYNITGGTAAGKYSVRISTTGIGAADFVTELLPETTITNTTAQEKIINIPATFTGPVNIAFAVVPGTGQSATRVIIDDVFIEDKPACSDPITPAVQNITTTSADLKWLVGDLETQWEVAIQPLGSGVPTGNGTLVSVGDANVTFATPNVTLAASGLNPAIRYEYYVRAYCSSTQKSNWVGPLAFTTLCGSFNAPYTETFDDTDVNTKKFCWSTNNVNADAIQWSLTTTEARIGRGFAAPALYNDWIISPAINAVGNKKLTFKYRALTSAFVATPRFGVEVLMSTTDTNPSSFTTVLQPWMEFNNTVYEEKSLYFTGAGPVYIAFRVPPTVTSPGTLSILNIDDVKIEDAPACPDPFGLNATLITQNSASLSWSQGYAETQWQVAVQPEGTGIPTGSGALVSSNVYVPSLSPNTAYEYYVRAYCGTSNTSNWVGPFRFRTLCTVFNAPFLETFNSDSSSKECWRVTNGNNDRSQWSLNVTVNPYEGDQMAGMFTGSNGANNDWLISPTINVLANQRLRYYYRVNDSFFTEDLKVKLSVNGVELNQFTTVLYESSTDPVLINNVEYKEKIINLPPGVTGSINVAWQIPPEPPSPSTYRGQLLFIDNVVVEDIPLCPQPSNPIVQSVSDTQAQILWDANGSGTTWEISVQPYGTDAPVGNTLPQYLYTATTNPYTVTGLTPAIRYEYYIRSICSGGTSQSEWIGPFEFATRCSFVNQCQYTITLDNGAVGSGPAGPIQVMQNGVVVQELNFPSGTPTVPAAPVDFIVSLCDGVQFSLFWDAIGTVPNQYPNAQVRIKDASGALIWSSPLGLGTPRRTMYTGVSSCSTVTCGQPTNLAVNAQSVLSWTAGGSETQWEVYIQPVGFGQLPQSGTLVSTNSYTPQASDFVNGTSGTYEYFVRALCGSGNNSFWSGPKVFVRNDDAANALKLAVNANEECNVSGSEITFIGATPSPEAMTCPGVNSGDVWVEFDATSKIHIIEANGFTGNFYISSGDEPYPDMTMTLYKVETDGSLTEKACSKDNVIVASYSSELEVGATYKVRLTLNNGIPNNSRTFNVCVKTPLDLCDFNAVNYDFENPAMQRVTGVSTISTEYVVPGWRVNLNTWDAMFFNEPLNTQGAVPYSGGQSLQILADPSADWNPSDPNIKGTYKDLDTSEITQMDYSFAHAARSNSGSSIQLYAGPVAGPFTLVNEAYSPGAVWTLHQGSYMVPTGQNVTRFIFRSKENVIGNLLDAANFKPNNEIKTADKTLTCLETSTVVQAEGVGQWVADAANPAVTIIETPNSKVTTISGYTVPGVYVYHWKTRYCDKTISITYQGINEVASVTSPANYCVTQAGAPLTANAPGGYTLMWYTQPVGGTGSTTAPTPDTSATGSTTYYVSVVDAGGCIGPRTEIIAVVNALPTATISGTTTICSGGTAAVTFSGTANATVTYTIDGGVNQTVTLDASGTATVTTPALTSDSTYALVDVASTCSQSVNGSAVITVNALPTATISGATTICSGATATVTFNGTANATVTYTIDGGANQTVTLDATGTATVTTSVLTADTTYALVDVTSAGMLACSQTVSGSTTITVSALPTASIATPTAVCTGSAGSVTFNGTANATVTYTIDGGANQTVTLDASGTATVTTSALTADSIYTLVDVTSAGTPACTQMLSGSATVSIIALPTATISGTTTICSGGTAAVTFNGTANATVTYTIDGGANQTVTLDASGTATITTPALTSDSTYALVDVASTCSQSVNGSAVITVNALPTATISGATTICSGATATVTFNGTANATVTYTIDGGANQTVTLDATGTATVTTSALTADTTYALVDVTSAGVLACSQTVTGSTTITVSALPTASIATPTAVCTGSAGSVTFNGTANATVTYTIDGGANQTVTLDASGTATVTTSALTADSIYALVDVTSAGTPACTQTLSGSATVSIIALPTATISGTTTICSGGTATVTFNGTANATVTYTIDGGANQMVTLDASGTATIATPALTSDSTYALVDVASTCSQSVNGLAVITVNALPTATISGATTICSGATATVTFNGTANATVTYTIDGGANQTVTLDATGTATVTTSVLTADTTYALVDVTSAGVLACSQTVTGSTTITVSALPTASIATPTAVCTGSAGSVTFNGTANATVTYTIDGGANQTVTLDASGTATVTTSALTADSIYALVDVTSAGTPACTQMLSGSATVVVIPLTTPNVVFSYNQSCVNATASPAPVLSVNFVTGGSFASTTLNVDPTTGVINLTGATAGTHQVTYTIGANTANCTAGGTYSASIILTNGSSAVTGFTYDSVYCPNSANALPQTVTGFEQGGVFSAPTGLAINPSTGEITIAGSTPGTYTVTYTVQPNTAICSTGGSSAFTLTISEALEIQVQDACNNFMLTLTALPVNGSFDPSTVNYTWHDANNTLIGSNTATLNVEEYLAQNPSVSLPFQVSVAIEDNGCTTVAYFTVKDNPCKIIPRGISPNNDQANDNFDLTGLGVNELLIFNRYGSKVYSFNGNYTNQWYGLSDDGNELPDGTYFYSIHKNNGTTVTGWVYINRQY